MKILIFFLSINFLLSVYALEDDYSILSSKFDTDFIIENNGSINETEIDEMIGNLLLLQPLLVNTESELWDYIYSFHLINYLKFVKQTKYNPHPDNYNMAKDLIERNQFYIDLSIKTDEQYELNQKLETKLLNLTTNLKELKEKLIKKNHQTGIKVINEHLYINEKLLNIVKKNLIVNETRSKLLYDRAIIAIKHYSVFV